MKAFKRASRKDRFIFLFCMAWAITGCSAVYLLSINDIHIDPYIVNLFFMGILLIIVLLKNHTKFGNWLEETDKPRYFIDCDPARESEDTSVITKISIVDGVKYYEVISVSKPSDSNAKEK